MSLVVQYDRVARGVSAVLDWEPGPERAGIYRAH